MVSSSSGLGNGHHPFDPPSPQTTLLSQSLILYVPSLPEASVQSSPPPLPRKQKSLKGDTGCSRLRSFPSPCHGCVHSQGHLSTHGSSSSWARQLLCLLSGLSSIHSATQECHNLLPLYLSPRSFLNPKSSKTIFSWAFPGNTL